MGEDKPFIEIEGMPIITRVHSIFLKMFEEVIIVTNEKELYKKLDARICNDLFPEGGVLGGIYTGLFFSSFLYSFCAACDMPFMKEPVIEYLIKNIEGYDVIVPRTEDGLQPLHAVYSKNCLEPIRKTIEEKKHRVVEFYSMVRTRVVEEREFISLDPLRESFINVNTPEELRSIRQGRHPF
jgi:molybdopterin-guanine dinucleotide biosynthesis protein A